MSKPEFGDGIDINALINQFEKMVDNDDIAFFDVREFEALFDYYEERNIIGRAIFVADMAIDQHTYSAVFYVRKAQILIDIDNDNEALELLEKATIYDASEVEIYLLKSLIFTKSEQYLQAIEVLQEAQQNVDTQDLDEIYLGYANIYEQQEVYEKVFFALRKALRKNPNNAEALERIYFVVEFTELYKESIALYNWILDQNPYSQQAWYDLGYTYLLLEDWGEAVDAFEFAYTIKEDFVAAYRECVEALLHLKAYDKAIKCLKEALKYTEVDNAILSNLAYCLEQMGDYNEAVEYYIKLVNLKPDCADYHCKLGNCLLENEDHIGALKSMNRAIELDNTNSKYYVDLAEIYAHIGDPEHSDEWYRKALELDTGNSEIWVDYICFLVDFEEYEIAEEALKLADEFCDGKELIYAKIGVLYFAGKQKEAMVLLQCELEENYESHQILFDLFPDLQEDNQIMVFIAIHKY